MLSRLVEAFKKRRATRELGRLEQQVSLVPHMAWGEAKALGKMLRPRRRALERVLNQIDQRLLTPIGNDPIIRHASTDWVWRPEILLAPLMRKSLTGLPTGMGLCEEIKIFHDCHYSEVNLRQSRCETAQSHAPFGLDLEVYDFDGSFMSLAIDLPETVLAGLGPNHIIRLDLQIETEVQVELIARLNIKQGPDNAQILRDIPLGHEGAPQGEMVEFDLAYAKLEERGIEKLWLDLIFGNVEMNRIRLRDISLSRRLRSQL